MSEQQSTPDRSDDDLPNVELGSTTFEKLQRIEPPNVLYHYTDQTGLLGILTSGELHATKVQYMNDSTEFGRAVDLAKNRMKAHVANMTEEDRQILEYVIDNLDRISYINVCVVSFCKNPDLLSQWQGYSGSSGVGFSIGFFSQKLVETTHTQGCGLCGCIYDEPTQIEIVDELIDQIINFIATHRNEYHPYALQITISSAIQHKLIQFGAFFKDAAFREEQEWRLATEVKFYPAFRFRAGKSMLIPYFGLKVKNESWGN
jgi:hypothetical protein